MKCHICGTNNTIQSCNHYNKTMQDIITFYHIEEVQGQFVKTIQSGIVMEKFRGGFLIQSSKFPKGKCIASENVINNQ